MSDSGGWQRGGGLEGSRVSRFRRQLASGGLAEVTLGGTRPPKPPASTPARHLPPYSACHRHPIPALHCIGTAALPHDNGAFLIIGVGVLAQVTTDRKAFAAGHETGGPGAPGHVPSEAR